MKTISCVHAKIAETTAKFDFYNKDSEAKQNLKIFLVQTPLVDKIPEFESILYVL